MFSLSYHLQDASLNTVLRNVTFNLLCFRAKKGWPSWRFKRRAGLSACCYPSARQLYPSSPIVKKTNRQCASLTYWFFIVKKIKKGSIVIPPRHSPKH